MNVPHKNEGMLYIFLTSTLFDTSVTMLYIIHANIPARIMDNINQPIHDLDLVFGWDGDGDGFNFVSGESLVLVWGVFSMIGVSGFAEFVLRIRSSDSVWRE